MKTLKRLCFALLLTGLITSCVPESTDADAELYLSADEYGTGNSAGEGGGD